MLKIKVCGMRDSANIQSVLALDPDFMGFIFFEKSPRNVGEELDAELLKSFPKTTKKVGVFVNAHPDLILKNVKKYNLDIVQLHGEELPDVGKNIRNRGITVIKAFNLDENFNFARLNNYKPHCDYFLFDAKGAAQGGNGITFDWNLLQRYDNEKPFFLSGGLNIESLDAIVALKNKGLNLYGVDINSQFEVSPGIKNVEKVKEFIDKLHVAFKETLA
ncbi:phosphoribosylanthranilate isomerase [Cytophagaceae bacterium DM2B3-1]|uniref:N-(5'-phosphoribosyl)anthranilate isomerase n=1 Tax=Xanthocytophaga flava TaxID=3048013 RepID=A0AAE3U913_9BACT|nr:phosphoribosylanthranilate isomerase [Xanthocytophaga flavus]MDJ1483212.1 phosphoribosylanthranilate isomerase [Xanthocytophaga flavus]MDJ1494321.1 phosphoribosylanthranilate isomerase [Xanthocytophaga flavus]